MHKIKYMDTNFWEFSLYFPRELLCYFNALKTELKSIFCTEKNCVNISIKNDRYCFLLAITKDAYQKNLLLIKEKIAEIIMVYYKPKIIINSIKNFSPKSHDDVILIDILTSFDYYQDKSMIVSKLSLCKKLYLDSFVNFKLQKLTDSWKETGDLINQNSLFVIDKSVKSELIQFLMNGIISKVDYVKLFLQNGKIYSNDKNTFMPVFYGTCEYDNLLFDLIKTFPKKIEIEHYKNFDINFIQNLHDLFADKICLVE